MGITKKKIKIIIFGASGSMGSYLVKEYILKIVNYCYLLKIQNQKKIFR